MKNVFVIAFAVLAIVASSEGLSCLPCSEVTCDPLYRLGCKGGLTTDPCQCCVACAKLRGERCGGAFNVVGKCDCGLKCRRPNVNVVGRCVYK